MHVSKIAVTLTAAAMVLSSGPALAGGAKAGKLMATLSGDADGTGSFKAWKSEDGKLCYKFSVADIDTPTMAHIHVGEAGATGGVIVPLQAPEVGSELEACAEADAAKLDEIWANPAGYYVNVHNAEFRGGAVRGQLAPVAE